MTHIPKRELVELNYPVAVLDCHTFAHPTIKGKMVDLNEARLKQIAVNMNRRIKDTGDESPIVIGHTKDGLPEKYQPEVIGFARDWVVGPFFKTGRKALFSRWRVFKDRLDKLTEYPRRSVELWLGKWEVDPISVLGATTPDRDLGLIRLSRDNQQHVTSVFGESAMDPQQIAQTVIAQLQQMPQFQFLNALMEQVQGQEGQGDEAVPPDESGQAGDEMPPEELPPEGGGDELPPEEEPEEGDEQPVRRAAYPSGSNTSVPSGQERKRMSRQQPAASQDLANHPVVRKLIEKCSELQEMNQAVVCKLSRSEREKDLIRLQAEHDIDLDVEEELALVAPDGGDPLPNDQYQAHLGRIVKRYQRAPVNQPRIITAHGLKVGPDPRSRANAAAELALSKGIKFEQALTEIDSQSQE